MKRPSSKKKGGARRPSKKGRRPLANPHTECRAPAKYKGKSVKLYGKKYKIADCYQRPKEKEEFYSGKAPGAKRIKPLKKRAVRGAAYRASTRRAEAEAHRAKRPAAATTAAPRKPAKAKKAPSARPANRPANKPANKAPRKRPSAANKAAASNARRKHSASWLDREVRQGRERAAANNARNAAEELERQARGSSFTESSTRRANSANARNVSARAKAANAAGQVRAMNAANAARLSSGDKHGSFTRREGGELIVEVWNHGSLRTSRTWPSASKANERAAAKFRQDMNRRYGYPMVNPGRSSRKAGRKGASRRGRR